MYHRTVLHVFFSSSTLETKEVYEGEVTELSPVETENPVGGFSKTVSHVVIGKAELNPLETENPVGGFSKTVSHVVIYK